MSATQFGTRFLHSALQAQELEDDYLGIFQMQALISHYLHQSPSEDLEEFVKQVQQALFIERRHHKARGMLIESLWKAFSEMIGMYYQDFIKFLVKIVNAFAGKRS